MKIIKANERNAKAITNLIIESIDNLAYNYSKSQIRAWKFINRLREVKKWFNEREVFLAVEKGKIIGTASLRENKISRFFIKPNLQGKGIGRKLINFLEKRAKAKEYNKIILESVPSAYGFYRKLDYKSKGRKNSYYHKIKFPEIKMEKKL